MPVHTSSPFSLQFVCWQCPFIVWQDCSFFILIAPHFNTLYAAKVLITSQFFIYIPFSFTLSMKWRKALRLTRFFKSLCHPHRNNYFAAVLFQITSTWTHLCYSDILCVTRKKFLRVLHTHNHLWSQDECTDRLRRRNVSADSRCLTWTVVGLQMICVQRINVNRLQSLCPWSHRENSTLFVPAELSPGYFLVQQEKLLRTNGLFKWEFLPM